MAMGRDSQRSLQDGTKTLPGHAGRATRGIAEGLKDKRSHLEGWHCRHSCSPPADSAAMSPAAVPSTATTLAWVAAAAAAARVALTQAARTASSAPAGAASTAARSCASRARSAACPGTAAGAPTGETRAAPQPPPSASRPAGWRRCAGTNDRCCAEGWKSGQPAAAARCCSRGGWPARQDRWLCGWRMGQACTHPLAAPPVSMCFWRHTGGAQHEAAALTERAGCPRARRRAARPRRCQSAVQWPPAGDTAHCAQHVVQSRASLHGQAEAVGMLHWWLGKHTPPPWMLAYPVIAGRLSPQHSSHDAVPCLKGSWQARSWSGVCKAGTHGRQTSVIKSVLRRQGSCSAHPAQGNSLSASSSRGSSCLLRLQEPRAARTHRCGGARSSQAPSARRCQRPGWAVATCGHGRQKRASCQQDKRVWGKL